MKKALAVGAGGLFAPYVLPSGIVAAPGRTAPSDRIVLAGIGVGSRGGQLLNQFNSYNDVVIAAVADPDMRRCRQVAHTHNAVAYEDYRHLLEREQIDGVVIASTDHWHAIHSIHAMQAGCDVFCEKSLTLTIHEGRVMAQAAEKYGKIVQTGSQQRSSGEFYRACMLIRNGYLGKIHRVVGVSWPGPWENAMPARRVPPDLNWDLWLGPAPLHPYHPEIKNNRGYPGWLSIKDFCGGEITGWGTHDIDQIHWALGADNSGPEQIWTEGKPYRPWIANRPDRSGRFFGAKDPIIHMRYPGNVHVEYSENRAPSGGARFYGEHGSLYVGRGFLELSNEEWREIPLDSMSVQLHTSSDHYYNFIDCMRDRTQPVTHVEIGHRSATACHLGNIARWISERTRQTGDRLHWDAQAERFTNNDWGNFYLDRPRRHPYQLPELV